MIQNLRTAYTENSKQFTSDQFEEILVYFSKSIHGKENEDEIFWDLAKNCIAKLGLVDCVVYTVDHKSNQLIQKAAFGSKDAKNNEIYSPVAIKLGQGISGSVALSGIPEIVSDTSKDKRYILDDENRLSEIAVPIEINKGVIGVIDCEHPEKGYFTQQHLRMLTAVASICAIKIQNVRADKKIKEEQEKLFKIREEMLHLKLKAFRSQMNPHFIFNALSGIQYFITSGNKKQALNYLSVFSRLIRFYLNHIEKETVHLADEVAMLKGYLILQKLRYSDHFNYNIYFEKNSKIEATIPSFVLQTLFENIIEHAIYNQYRNYTIQVVFKTTKKHVLINIAFTYDITKKEDVKYIPDYREQVIKWQDQIRLLNKFKSYKIEKKVTFNKNSALNGGTIELILPNLS